MDKLARRVIQGEVRALARACRLIDDRRPGYRELLSELFPHSQAAWVLGVTGSPGAGKSTLTDALVAAFRADNKRVAVVAVDPTSPFSGGAFLGDRIRLQRHFEDPEVFIRSLATRGALGGLSRSTQDTIVALAAWQAQVVIVETVGVGQDELDVTSAADTTCVVVAPGMGDDIQATKAGILESADVFAVNKADREGAERTVRDLEGMLALGAAIQAVPSVGHHAARLPTPAHSGEYTPPIVRTVATRREGIVELLTALEAHRKYLDTSGARARRRQNRHRLLLMTELREALLAGLTEALADEVSELLESIERAQMDPYQATDRLCARWEQLRSRH